MVQLPKGTYYEFKAAVVLGKTRESMNKGA